MEFVQAANYNPGRLRPIRLICVHSTESPCNVGGARAVANYFARGPGASSHYVVDPTNIVQCVAESDTAWCAPNANADGLHIEQCGYAQWSRTEWLTGQVGQMIRTQTAPLVAALAARYGIPLRALTPAQVRAGERGICAHVDVTNAYPGSGSHWDCGGGYPMDVLLEAASGSQFAPAAVEVPDMVPEDFDKINALIARAASNTHKATVDSLGPKLDTLSAAIQALAVRPAGDVHIDTDALSDAVARKLLVGLLAPKS